MMMMKLIKKEKNRGKNSKKGEERRGIGNLIRWKREMVKPAGDGIACPLASAKTHTDTHLCRCCRLAGA